MGAFYTNITLHGPDQEQVIQCLTQMKRTAYVSPTVDGYTVVYDEETENQDDADLMGLASQLSRALDCPAFAALVHDSDIFAYWLFQEGTLLDEYDSAPGYLQGFAGPARSGEHPDKLCAAFAAEDALEAVAQVFRTVESRDLDGGWSAGYTFAQDIHHDLAQALGMPSFAVATGYRYIEASDIPKGLERAVLVGRL
jgi:hypothetical protein